MTITVKGTGFSTDAVTDDIFYRTDLGAWYQYNGSGWEGIGFLNLGASQAATISSGAFTATKTHILVAPEGAAADDLDTINGTSTGDIIILGKSGAYTITVKDGTGNLALAGDFALDSTRDYIVLLNRDGTNICELARSNNA